MFSPAATTYQVKVSTLQALAFRGAGNLPRLEGTQVLRNGEAATPGDHCAPFQYRHSDILPYPGHHSLPLDRPY